MHTPGYIIFLIILGGIIIGTHLGYQLFKWATTSDTSTAPTASPEEHPLRPLLHETSSPNYSPNIHSREPTPENS